MKVVVCMKHILDPELPPSAFEIESEKKQAKSGKHAFVLNPYDENALEMALQLKDGKRGSGSRPDDLILFEVRVQDGLQLGEMTGRRNAADGEPDTFLDEVAVGLAELEPGSLLYLLQVNPVRSRCHHQDGGVCGLVPEDERFCDLGDPASDAVGRLL